MLLFYYTSSQIRTLTTKGAVNVMSNNIYHYCSLETFNTIINNKTLRASDITKSNDIKN